MDKLLKTGTKINKKLGNQLKQLDGILGRKGYYFKLEPSSDRLIIEIKKKPKINFSSSK